MGATNDSEFRCDAQDHRRLLPRVLDLDANAKEEQGTKNLTLGTTDVVH
jgi:hypothetical protein